MEVSLLKSHPFIRKHEITLNLEPNVITDVNTSLITNVNSFILAAKANLMAKEMVKASENLPTEPNIEKRDSSHTPKSPLAMFKQRSSPIVMSRPFNPTGQVGPFGFAKGMHHLHPGGFTDMVSSPKGENSPVETPNRSIIVDTNLVGTAKFKDLRQSEKPSAGQFETPRLPTTNKPNKELITPEDSDVSVACSDDIIKMQDQLLREMMGLAEPVQQKPPVRSETFASSHTFGGKHAQVSAPKPAEPEMDEEELLREQDRLLREMMGEASPPPVKPVSNSIPEAEMDVEELMREQERLLAEMMGGPAAASSSNIPTRDTNDVAAHAKTPADDMNVEELIEEQNRLLMEMMAGDQQAPPNAHKAIKQESQDMDSEELLREQERLLMEMMGTQAVPENPISRNRPTIEEDSEDLEKIQQRLLDEMMDHAAKVEHNVEIPHRDISARSVSDEGQPAHDDDNDSEVVHAIQNSPGNKTFLEDENLLAAKPLLEKLTANLRDEMISEESEKSGSESANKKITKPDRFDPVPLAAIKTLPVTRNLSNTAKLLTHAVTDQIVTQSKSNRPSMFIPEGAVLSQTVDAVNLNNHSPESSAFTSPQKGRGKVNIRFGSSKKGTRGNLVPQEDEAVQPAVVVQQGGESTSHRKAKMYYNPVEITPDQLDGPKQPGWDTVLPLQKRQLSLKALAVEERHRKEEERKQQDIYKGPFLDGYEEPRKQVVKGNSRNKEINLESKLRAQQHDQNAQPYSDHEDSSKSPSPTNQKLTSGSNVFFSGSRLNQLSKATLN